MADRETIEILLRLKDDFSKGLKNALKGSEAQTKSSGKSMRLMWTEIASAISLARQAVDTFKRGYEFAREGAEIERLNQRFDRLSASMNLSASFIDDVKHATGGLRSEFELTKAAVDIMALGLVENEEQLRRLITVSGELGFDMNQLVLTLTNMTTMRFDALGVSVDGFKERVKALEATGLSAERAFREAFLEQAEAQVERVGSAVDQATASFDRMEAQLEDTGAELKVLAATLLTDVEIAGRTFIEWVSEGAQGLSVLVTGIQSVSNAQAEHAQSVDLTAISYEEWNRQQTSNLTGIEQLTFALTAMGREEFEAIQRQQQLSQSTAELEDKLFITSQRLDRDLAPALENAGGSLSFLDTETRLASAAFADLDRSIGNTIEGMIDDMKFFSAGGAEIALMAGMIQQAFKDEEIPLSRAVELMEALQAETLQVQQDAGLISFEEAKRQAADWGIALDDPLADMQLIADIYDKITQDQSVRIRYQLSTSGEGPASGATALQHGGPLGGISLVGEAGPELIVGGVVIPAGTTRKLLNLGLKPGRKLQGGGFAFDPDTLRQITGSTMETQLFSAKSAVTKATVAAARAASTGTTTVAPSTQQDVIQVVEQSIEAGQTAAKETVQAAIQLAIQQQSQNFQVQFERQDRRSQEQLNALERIEVVLRDQASENSLRDIMFESKDTSGF